ncbi:cell wall-binding repeat-containing protein [Robertmurraya sp. GLU-23]
MFKSISKKVRLLTLLIVSLGIFSVVSVKAETSRLSGATRYETAVKISQQGWSSSDIVLLAQGLDFPDALASVPLAHKLNAPILLTIPTHIPIETVNEIKRLNTKKVIILGGPNAVSNQVETYLREKIQVNVERIAGETRFETSEAIANRLGIYEKAFIVNGYNYPDALSIGSYAAVSKAPIILTKQTGLTQNSKQFALRAKERFIIGGEAVVSSAIQGELQASRISGADRYETSSKILDTFYKEFPNIYVATGGNFADALSGAVLGAKTNSPVVLSKPDMVPDYMIKTLKHYLLSNSYILGGEAALSNNVQTIITQKLAYVVTDTSKSVIFYIPHPDDEVLATGAGIQSYLAKGFNVQVVLLSHGRSSAVLQSLMNIYPELTPEEFGNARVREFMDSITRLGVNSQNIHVYDFPDQGLTVESISSIISEYENKYPFAEHRTLSFFETHSDHRNSGLALKKLLEEGKVTGGRFYISPYLHNQVEGFVVRAQNPEKVIDALYAYKVNIPEEGRYSIGYLSVPDLINMVENNPISKAHLAN